MAKKLKILTEFGNEGYKSLLIELDKTIADQLSVDENDMVDLVDFINICLLELNQQTSTNDEIDLHQLIFDTSIAVDTRKR